MKKPNVNKDCCGALIVGLVVGSLSMGGLNSAEAAVSEPAFFDKHKTYTDELYVLKDYLEFTVFDLSQMQVVDKSGTAKYVPEEQKEKAVEDLTGDLPQLGQVQTSAEAEIRQAVDAVPKLFFAALKHQIQDKKVPVTLYATGAPDYANPIKLYIKIKEIHLLPVEISKTGEYFQPLIVRVYGQIKDKRSGKILIRYYDTAQTRFALKKKQANAAFELVAEDLMGGLAEFLKTRY